MTANTKNGKYCSRSVNYKTPTCIWIFKNQILCRVSKKLPSLRKMLRFVPSKRYKNWFNTFTCKLFLTLSFVLSSYLHVLSIVTSSFPSIELSICRRVSGLRAHGRSLKLLILNRRRYYWDQSHVPTLKLNSK